MDGPTGARPVSGHGQLAILDGLGEDAADEFIIALDQYKKDMLQETGKNVTAGISFRWTLGSKKGDPEVLLLAQVKTTYSRNITFHLQGKILPVDTFYEYKIFEFIHLFMRSNI